jgi:hypothetical protein
LHLLAVDEENDRARVDELEDERLAAQLELLPVQ